jgi:hypothetical protein
VVEEEEEEDLFDAEGGDDLEVGEELDVVVVVEAKALEEGEEWRFRQLDE